jgi:hypothetical protein
MGRPLRALLDVAMENPHQTLSRLRFTRARFGTPVKRKATKVRTAAARPERCPHQLADFPSKLATISIRQGQVLPDALLGPQCRRGTRRFKTGESRA